MWCLKQDKDCIQYICFLWIVLYLYVCYVGIYYKIVIDDIQNTCIYVK